MIDHEVSAVGYGQRVVRSIYRICTESKAHVTNDGIIELNPSTVIGYTDTIAGRGLTGDRNIRMIDIQTADQIDRATDIEHNRARSASGVDSFTQSAGAAVGQACDMINVASTSAGSVRTSALRARKRDEDGQRIMCEETEQ